MFINVNQSVESKIKVYREVASPERIWLRLTIDTYICVTLPEAQEIFSGIQRELQAEIAAAVVQA